MLKAIAVSLCSKLLLISTDAITFTRWRHLAVNWLKVDCLVHATFATVRQLYFVSRYLSNSCISRMSAP